MSLLTSYSMMPMETPAAISCGSFRDITTKHHCNFLAFQQQSYPIHSIMPRVERKTKVTTTLNTNFWNDTSDFILG